jgi:hypothetical protein
VFRRIVLIAVCLLGLENFALAQTNGYPGLRGLSGLGFLVDGLDEDAKRCGLTKSAISDAFLYIASSAKFKITTEPFSPQFLVHVGTLIQRKPGQCVTDLAIQVANYQKVNLDFGDKLTSFAWVELWKDNWIEVSDTGRHRQRVQRRGSLVPSSSRK